MHRSQRFCHLLNASRKSCFVRVLNIACDSAQITSIVSKLADFSFIFNRGNRKVGSIGTTVMLFLVKKFPCENEV
jgi:hypothetical protein